MLTDWGKRAAELAEMTKQELVAEIGKYTDSQVYTSRHLTRPTLVSMLARFEESKYNAKTGMLIGEKS